MSHLRELQMRFQDYLTSGNEAIEKDIVSTADALAEHRLGTYYNAYRLRLIDILALDYSTIAKYLGREAFEDEALGYLEKYPSTNASVRWFGEEFAQYLRHDSRHADRDFLSEMAQFEWTQGLVFDAKNTPALLELDAMAQVPPQAWPGVTILFKPAIRWLDLYWNVCPYADAIANGETPAPPHRQELPVRWLLWRKRNNPHWRSLEVHEAWALQAAHRGNHFAEICEGLCEWVSEDQVAMTAAGFLKQWISDELVIGVNY